MKGITMTDLYDYISQGHEAEFTYKDTLYVIQPEVVDNKSYLVIWNCEKDAVPPWRSSFLKTWFKN